MSKQDITTKLAATEASLKRWQTRLKRAAKMVHDLDRKRRRYQLMLLSEGQPVAAILKAKKQIETDDMPEADFEKFAEKTEPKLEADIAAIVDQHLEMPVFMQRSLKQKVSEEERKKMPLSGRDAEAFLKKQSEKVTARRTKKELRLRK